MNKSRKNKTADEINREVSELSDVKRNRLYKNAQWFVRGISMSHEDLFHEAITRTLDGQRLCPQEVGVEIFLTNAMKSVASSERKKAVRLTSLDAELPDSEQNLEESAINRHDWDVIQQNLHTHFSNDSHVMAILLMEFEEDGTKNDVKEFGEMNDKEYDSARKRLRRHLKKIKHLEKENYYGV